MRIGSCDTRAASPHCPGSRRRQSPAPAGWPSTRDSPTTTSRRRGNSVTSRNSARRTGSGSPTCCGPGSRSATTGQITGAGYGGGGLIGSTTVRLAGLRYRFQAVKLPDIQRPPEHGPGWVRFTQTVGGRTGAAGAPAGQAPAVRAVAGAAGVDHADPHPARRRHRRARDDRGEHVPPALGLRRGRPPDAQVRPDRLRQLVRHVVRQAQPVGRRGLPGAGHRGRDGAGTGAVRAAHARRGQAGDQPARGGGRAGPPGGAGNLGVPGAGRRDPGRAGRRAARRVRPGGDARRAGPARRAASGRPRWWP